MLLGALPQPLHLDSFCILQRQRRFSIFVVVKISQAPCRAGCIFYSAAVDHRTSQTPEKNTNNNKHRKKKPQRSLMLCKVFEPAASRNRKPNTSGSQLGMGGGMEASSSLIAGHFNSHFSFNWLSTPAQIKNQAKKKRRGKAKKTNIANGFSVYLNVQRTWMELGVFNLYAESCICRGIVQFLFKI